MYMCTSQAVLSAITPAQLHAYLKLNGIFDMSRHLASFSFGLDLETSACFNKQELFIFFGLWLLPH